MRHGCFSNSLLPLNSAAQAATMDHNHRVAGLLGADALGLAPVCENSLLNAWIWRSIYIIKIEEEVLGPCRPKGAFRDCFVCAHLPDGIDVDGSTPFKRVAMFDGVCTHIRYAEGGNALCCGTLDHFVGEPNRKIEATRATVVADAVREGGTPPPPSDFECPRACRLRCSRVKWLALHKQIADCGWAGSCCRHLFALREGYLSMAAPECHLFYFYLFDKIVMEGGDEHVDIIHLDIG